MLYTRRKLEEARNEGFRNGYSKGYDDAKEQRNKDYQRGYKRGHDDRDHYYDQVVIPKINNDFENYKKDTNNTIKNMINKINSQNEYIDTLHESNIKLLDKLGKTITKDIERLELLKNKVKSYKKKKKIESRIQKILLKKD